MDILFQDFGQALEYLSGPNLAATISPVPPPHYLNRLDAIYRSTNYASAERDIGYKLTKSWPGPIKYPSSEISTWTDIYLAFWNACGEILAAQNDTGRADWEKVYEAWKDLANAVIRGYSSGVLEAWTLPVLYTAGKFLRLFAIKADESAKKKDSGVDMDLGGMQDDIAGDYGKNVKLEDAARVINRMFTLCISDRYGARTSDRFRVRLTMNPGLLLKNPVNGGCTTQQISYSRPISNSILSVFARISFEHYLLPQQTCLL